MQHGGLAVADFISHPLDHFHDFQSFISLRHKMTTHQLHKPIINRVDFLKQIALCLPQVATCIDESEFGNVHLEVGAVRKATQNAMAELDFATVREHLHLIADLFDRANAELYSAIRISYLEALFLGEISVPHLEARSMLSNFMENMLRQAELDLDRDCV
jgi:hypothetical protein